jgi:hypothetical protein
MEYPFGFQFVSAEPQPSKGNNLWSLGDIASLQKKNISIKGFVEGQDLDQRAFNVSVGILNNDGNIVPYGMASETLTVKKSAFDLMVFLQGQNKEKNVVRAGDSVRVDLQWVNNLPYPIRDSEIELEVTGRGFDPRTFAINRGSYRTFDKKVVWNYSTLSDLGLINPGDYGTAHFSFLIQDSLPIHTLNDKDFAISLNAKISGIRVAEDAGIVEISGTASKTIKIASDIQLAARALYSTGEFENTGPLPPQAGKETTYNITWSLVNTSNDFSGARIRANLPSYVRWVGKYAPGNESVSFNEKSGEVVWDAGDVSAGTGLVTPAKKVTFQIALTPSLSQIGESPNLVEQIRMEAHNDFIDEDQRDTVSSLNTSISNDPQFEYSQGIVVE